MTSAPDIAHAFRLPPKNAVEYFEKKVPGVSWRWWDVWQEAHAKAFVVAKCTQMDVLKDIHDMVQKAVKDGISIQQFKKELTPLLQAKGWWGRQLREAPDGTKERVQLGSHRRLETIYRVNTQTAYMVGRYKSMVENVDDRPFWQYVAVLDSRTRPGHRALDGKVFRHDDPFWDSFYPPNGWRCRCRARALSQADMDAGRLRPLSSEGRLSSETKVISKKTGEAGNVTVYTDPHTGVKSAPDVGWSYNPGKSSLEPFTPAMAEPEAIRIAPALTGKVPRKILPLDDIPATKIDETLFLPAKGTSPAFATEEDYIRAFLAEFNTEIGKPVVFTDVMGEPLVISDQMFWDKGKQKYKATKRGRERYLRLLADTIKDPDEIWLDWAEVDGKKMPYRKHIKIYKDQNGKIAGFSTFESVGDKWIGTTIYKPDKLRYIDDRRRGALLYTKY